MSNGASLDFVGQSLGDVLSEFTKQHRDEFGQVILQKTVFGILKETVNNNFRVDTGAMRGNWQVSRNIRNRRIEGRSKTGKGAISRGKRVIKSIKTKDTVFIYNNLPYTHIWEEEDRMLRDAVRKYTRNLEKNLEKTRL